MKKAEFKTKREINEAKIAEEFAKSQLKEEKAKTSVLDKKVHDAEEVRRQLEKKLDRLVEEKGLSDKELEQLRNQYKEFKR